MSDWNAWFDRNLEETAQKLRILRSGLKPEAGAWERSMLRIEMARGEWGLTPRALEERRLSHITTRFINDMARWGMPKSRKRSDNFCPAVKQPAPQPSWWDAYRHE